MLYKASKETLFDNIIKQVQLLIQEGKLKPGDRMPPERELAEQLNVSRNTLREAFKALELVGVVKVKQGEGTYISSDLNTELMSAPFNFIALTELRDILDLLEVRHANEVAIAYAVAQRIDADTLEKLEKNLERMEKNIKNEEICTQCDAEFHMLLALASKNKFFIQFQRITYKHLIKAMSKTAYLKRALAASIYHHGQIIQAIKDKNPEAAQRAMKEHLVTVENEVKKEMRDAEEKSVSW